MEVREVADLRREGPVEGIAIKDQALEPHGGEQARRNAAEEPIGP